MKTFCYAPWSNIEILPSGDILPCCKFLDSSYKENFNIATHSIDDYRSSKMLQQIKQELSNNQWPQGCQRCKIEEDSNIPSKRQLDYQRWGNYYDNYDLESGQLLTISMALGNTCNLKCIMCNPSASSAWAKEYKDLYNQTFPVISEFRTNTIQLLTQHTDQLIHIDIHGGEPLLSGIKEHQALLDFYIQNNRAKDISIHYTTNGTVWPSQEWFDRWQHFREVDLQISIDGVAQRYEYIRHPADWNVLKNNVIQYLNYEQTHHNFRLSVAHTVSAFNIYYIDEFFAWCEHIGLPKPWTGRLHRPNMLQASVWSEPATDAIVKKLQSSSRPEVQAWTSHMKTNNNSQMFEKFLPYVRRHDAYRNTDFQRTFVELAEYVK